MKRVLDLGDTLTQILEVYDKPRYGTASGYAERLRNALLSIFPDELFPYSLNRLFIYSYFLHR